MVDAEFRIVAERPKPEFRSAGQAKPAFTRPPPAILLCSVLVTLGAVVACAAIFTGNHPLGMSATGFFVFFGVLARLLAWRELRRRPELRQFRNDLTHWVAHL